MPLRIVVRERAAAHRSGGSVPLTIDEGGHLITERREVRAALASSEVGQALDEIVQELLA